MKVRNFAGTLLAMASLFVGVVSSAAAAESGYSFSVRNNTRVKIAKLLVSILGKALRGAAT